MPLFLKALFVGGVGFIAACLSSGSAAADHRCHVRHMDRGEMKACPPQSHHGDHSDTVFGWIEAAGESSGYFAEATTAVEAYAYDYTDSYDGFTFRELRVRTAGGHNVFLRSLDDGVWVSHRASAGQYQFPDGRATEASGGVAANVPFAGHFAAEAGGAQRATSSGCSQSVEAKASAGAAGGYAESVPLGSCPAEVPVVPSVRVP